MPRIRQYENQQGLDVGSTLNAGRVAETSAYYAGQAIKGGFNALAEGVDKIGNYVAQSETSKLAADFATAQADLSKEWNDTATKADPNDPDLANNFLEKSVKPRIEKIGADLLTPQAQQTYQKMSAALHADLFVKAHSDQARLAGEAAVANVDTVKNQLSNSVRVDPSSLNFALKQVDMTVDDLVTHAGLTRADALKLTGQVKGEIAKSAVYGMAEKNPAAAREAIARGDFNSYLDGTEIKAAEGYIKDQEEAAERGKRIAEENARKEAAYRSTQRENEYLTSFSDPASGQTRVPANALAQVLADPVLTPEAKTSLRVAIKALTEKPDGEIKNDPGAYLSLFNRIHLPDGDPRKITDENELNQYVGRGLNMTGLTQLRGEIQGRRTDEGQVEADLKKNFIATARRLLTATDEFTGLRDPKGDENLQRFMQKFLPMYDKAVKAGQNPLELLDIDGPMGKMLNTFKRDPVQWMNDVNEANGPGAVGGGPPGATKTMINPKTNQKIFLVNGKWVDAAGKAVQ